MVGFVDGYGVRQTALLPGVAVVRWLACDAVDAHWLDLLDPAELARADRFHFARDRASFTAAHALARVMLAQYGGRHARDWHFVTGPFGKPSPHPDLGSDLAFNISHTHGMAACVVARDSEVGVDIEALGRSHDAMALAGRWFRPEEAALLEAAAVDERPSTFLRLWTMKESVMKATGRGFDLGLDEFAVTLDPPTVRFNEQQTGAWSFAQGAAGKGHVIAAAARAERVVFDVSAADLGALEYRRSTGRI